MNWTAARATIEMSMMKTKPNFYQRLILCAVILASTGACKLLTPLVFITDQKKQVTAEFDKLTRSKVAVMVWADQATLFDYPFVRFELASYANEKLSVELSERKKETTLIDSRDIDDFLQRNMSAQTNPALVGQHFDVDYVIYIELLEFQLRDLNQPQLLQGRLSASVSVLDMAAADDTPEQFQLVPVECLFPEGAPILFSANNSMLVRESLYRVFAEKVARKFYDYVIES